jgi:hypothetical protein
MPAVPWPVYRLEELLRRQEAPVLIVLGEAQAGAAAGVFPDHVVITSALGVPGVAKTDWSVPRGRAVTIWSSRNTDPYAEAARVSISSIGAISVSITQRPDWLPETWGFGDDLPPGRSLSDLREILRASSASQPDQHHVREGGPHTQVSQSEPLDEVQLAVDLIPRDENRSSANDLADSDLVSVTLPVANPNSDVLAGEDSTDIAVLVAAERALVVGTSVDAMKVRSGMEALRHAAKVRGAVIEKVNQFAEMKLKAERKIGAELLALDKHKGGGDQKREHRFPLGTGGPATLREIGISKKQASVWQNFARVPDADWQAEIVKVKAAGGELTSAGMHRFAKSLLTRDRRGATNGSYRCIVVGTALHRLRKIPDLSRAAAENCSLFMLTSPDSLSKDLALLRRWGFSPSFTIWSITNGAKDEAEAELIIHGVRNAEPKKQLPKFFSAPRPGDGGLPEALYDLVRTMYPKARLADVLGTIDRQGFERSGTEIESVMSSGTQQRKSVSPARRKIRRGRRKAA